MSDSVEAVYDDYDKYLNLCKKFGEKPRGIDEKFYNHLIELERRFRGK